MAVVTGRGAVHIPANAVMCLVRLLFRVRSLRVAIDAGEGRIVCGDEMAVAAHRAVVRNREICVIESSTEPRRSGMAGRARRRVSRRNVIRHASAERRRALPSRGVAAIAIGVGGSKGVVVVDVAGRAGRRHVSAGQRPTRSAVVKLPVRPLRNRMAHGARGRRLWESGLYMVRHVPAVGGRAVPGIEMAADAIRRIQRVVVADMAGDARRRSRRHVCTDECETG